MCVRRSGKCTKNWCVSNNIVAARNGMYRMWIMCNEIRSSQSMKVSTGLTSQMFFFVQFSGLHTLPTQPANKKNYLRPERSEVWPANQPECCFNKSIGNPKKITYLAQKWKSFSLALIGTTLYTKLISPYLMTHCSLLNYRVEDVQCPPHCECALERFQKLWSFLKSSGKLSKTLHKHRRKCHLL